jgi:hypothetical protein
MGSTEAAEQDGPPSSSGAESGPRPLVAVVGPCAAGKSVLVGALRAQGINAREVAQEHSYIPDMWLRITGPDVLVFLDVSLEQSRRRRPTDVTEAAWKELGHRLEHARSHADVLIQTDGLAPEEVLERVVAFLAASGTERVRAAGG